MEVVHHIQKVLVDVESNSKDHAEEVRSDLSAFIQKRILPIIEKILDDLTKDWASDDFAFLEKLTLDIQYETEEWQMTILEKKIEKEMERAIAEVLGDSNSMKKDFTSIPMVVETNSEQESTMKLVSLEAKILEGWIHFLKTGKRPWWSMDAKKFDDQISEKSLLRVLDKNHFEFQKNWTEIEQNKTVRDRLVAQYGTLFLVNLFHFQMRNESFPVKKASDALDKMMPLKPNSLTAFQFRQQLFANLLTISNLSETDVSRQREAQTFAKKWMDMVAVKSRKEVFKAYWQILKIVFPSFEFSTLETNGIISNATTEQEDQKAVVDVHVSPQKKQVNADRIVENQLFIENAGLVILHPFLTTFFDKIGLLDKDKKIEDVTLAVHVLHYLATGNEAGFEHNMLFEKFLMNHPINIPIERNILLSDDIKSEAKELLNSVLGHWDKLKGSSIEALQETFLQRSGKLINEYPQPRLIIERKTVDILMKDLSWSISILKFPWLDKLIFVEW